MDGAARLLSHTPGLGYVGLTRVKGDRSNRSAFVTVVNSDFGLRSFQERFERTA